MQRKAIAQETASGRYPRTGLVTFFALMAVAGALGCWRLRDARTPSQDELVDQVFPGNEVPPRPQERGEVTTTYEPEFAWIPVLVVVTLVAVGIGAAYLSARTAKGPLERR